MWVAASAYKANNKDYEDDAEEEKEAAEEGDGLNGETRGR
jgi:hypothetical protein